MIRNCGEVFRACGRRMDHFFRFTTEHVRQFPEHGATINHFAIQYLAQMQKEAMREMYRIKDRDPQGNSPRTQS